jgi:hypothetical protein
MAKPLNEHVQKKPGHLFRVTQLLLFFSGNPAIRTRGPVAFRHPITRILAFAIVDS